MMIKKILILVLLLCSSSFAQLSPRLDSMRVRVYDKANLPSSGGRAWTEGQVNRIINEEIQGVCGEFDAIWKIDTVTVGADSTGAALNSDFLRLKNVLYMTGDSLWIPLKIIESGDSLAVTFPTKKTNQAGKSTSPQDVKTCRVHAGRIIFHPKWTSEKTGSYFIEYWACDSLLNADASVTQVRPEFRQLIIDRSVAEILGK